MRKLNPIAAAYLKVLEFIAFLLVEVGGRWDDSLFPKNASKDDYRKAKEAGRRYRKHCRISR